MGTKTTRAIGTAIAAICPGLRWPGPLFGGGLCVGVAEGDIVTVGVDTEFVTVGVPSAATIEDGPTWSKATEEDGAGISE